MEKRRNEIVLDGPAPDGLVEPFDLPAVRHHFLLPRNLGAMAKLTAKPDTGRFGGTAGVYLTRTETGYRAEATNGRFLGIVTGEDPFDPEDYPTVPALDGAPNSGLSASIPAKDWAGAFKAIPKSGRYNRKPVLENVAVTIGETVTTLVSTDLERVNLQQPRNIDGRFPNTEQVFPREAPAVSVALDPAILETLLEVARQFTTDEAKRVYLEVYAKPNQAGAPLIGVNVKDPGTGQRFRGLMVGLVEHQA